MKIKTEHRTETALREARERLAELEAQEAAFNAEGWRLTVGLRDALARARRDVREAELADRYGHKLGTPETYAKIEEVEPQRRQSPLSRMYESGEIDDVQWQAVTEITAIAELIERDVAVRGASLEARVDNAGAARDVLIESLARVRLERCYTAWRNRLPMPRRLYLDMILTNRSLVATARVYGEPWRKARQRMLTALDMWADIKEQVWKGVDEEDVAAVYARIGCGVLMPPKPRPLRITEDEE